MICDSSAIIHLSRIGRLHLLRDAYGTIVVPKAVEREVLVGEKPGSEEICRAFKEGWLKAKAAPLTRFKGIHIGESQAIELALKERQILLVDDALAFRTAEALGIRVIRTTSVIMEATARKIITSSDAMQILNKLVETGYYLSPKHYAAIASELLSRGATK